MNITWHGDPYEFQPKTIDGSVDATSRHSTIDAPIFGADTESVQLAERYEPQCFTISQGLNPALEPNRLVYLPENDDSIFYFLEDFIYEYADTIFAYDHGHAILYYHNLEYDWLQLIKRNPVLLELARIGVGQGSDTHLFTVAGHKVFLRKDALFSGSAPHFRLKIQRSKTEFFNLHWRDTFSFFPSSLASAMKVVGLEVAKMERQSDLGLVDYRNIPDADPRKLEFEQYAKIDALGTRLLGEKIRDLHRSANMTKLRVSAPSYAINLLYHRMNAWHQEERSCSIRTGVDDPSIMQLIFDTYRGGRTGGVYHGKVEDITVLDFHSSYPASMATLPSFHPLMQYIRVDDLSLENVIELLEETGHAFLRVSGEETDPRYPALITTHNGLLTPIYGTFENVATTGVELLVGIKSGTLHISEVHEMVILADLEDDPILPIKRFVEENYEEKKHAEKGTVEYTRTKLALNSPYGKFIESREQTLVGARDAKVLLPYIPGMDKEFGTYYYDKYMQLFEEGSSFWDEYDAVTDEIMDAFPDESVEWKQKVFGDFTLSGRIYGRFVVPGAASLITATSRARLLVAMKSLDAYYWDTDSVFIQDMTEEEIARRLAIGNAWLPANIQPLQIGDELGDLGEDIRGAKGYLAGVKRYYLENETETKSATHGLAALSRDDTLSAIHALATGTPYEYDSKPRPMKAKEAGSAADIGSFRSKRYQPKFHLDERLSWEETGEGWIGTIRPFSSIQEQKVDPDLLAMMQSYMKGKDEE